MRPRLAAWLVVPSLVLVGAFPAAAQETASEEGQRLYVEACISCHGAGGKGTELGPPLVGAGAASADFQLRTGRMPLTNEQQAMRKPPAFSDEEIEALVDYVASLGPGPAIPDVDPALGDLPLGEELFISNCAPCHGATGNGGAAGEDALAPSLHIATPTEIGEAIITGPGEMPVFDFTARELDSIVAFIDHLDTEADRGGADIGGVGPVPEGFVAWTLGLGLLVLISVLLGKQRKPRDEEHV